MVHARGQKSTKLLMITGNTCNTAFVIAPQIARIILNDINVVSRDSRSCRIPAYSYPSFFSRNGFVRPWSMKDETRKCSRWIIPSQIDRNGNCCFTRLVETTCVTAIIKGTRTNFRSDGSWLKWVENFHFIDIYTISPFSNLQFWQKKKSTKLRTRDVRLRMLAPSSSPLRQRSFP